MMIFGSSLGRLLLGSEMDPLAVEVIGSLVVGQANTIPSW